MYSDRTPGAQFFTPKVPHPCIKILSFLQKPSLLSKSGTNLNLINGVVKKVKILNQAIYIYFYKEVQWAHH
jgi:hypothetical protein